MNLNEAISGKPVSLEQHRALQRENQMLRKKVAKLSDTTGNIAEVVHDFCISLPAEKPPVISTDTAGKRYPEERAVLNFSDAQLGSYVRKYMTGGLCEYNKTEFKKRIDRMRKSILECVRIQRGGGIALKQLNINILGDIVQGEAVFPGQGFGLDALLLEQTLTLSVFAVTDLIIPLSREFEKVEIFAVAGNHGRQGGPYASSREANWDFICYYIWKMMLREFKHINFYMSLSPFLIYELFPEQIHAIIHGNQARGYLGFPYYGVDRMFARLKTLTNLPIQYLHHGHHHQPSVQDAHIGRKLGNGSIEGGSEYSVCDLITANVPQQWFGGFNKKGVTWEYWIRLADAPKLTADANGIFTPVLEFDTLRKTDNV